MRSMAKFTSPSNIHFTTSMDVQDIKQTVITVFKKILTRPDEPPVIQVVESKGQYFAINNSKLETCRMLETQGKCHKVRLDILPPHMLPVGIQEFIAKEQSTDQAQDTRESSGHHQMSALCDDIKDGGDQAESESEFPDYCSSESDSDILDWQETTHNRRDEDAEDDEELGLLLS